MDFNFIYDIDRTVEFISRGKFTRVALQFPDELLRDSRRVVRALREKLRFVQECNGGENKSPETREIHLYVMADTAYGSCCVDEVGASHIGAECVIHYGHTCLSPISNLPALFVFGKASVSITKCAECISNLSLNRGKCILVLFALEFYHAMPSLKEELVAKSSNNILCAEVLCSSMDPCKDGTISIKEGEGDSSKKHDAEAGLRVGIGGLTWRLPENHKIEDFLIFWIGPDNAAFANVMLTFNNCETVRYDATENNLVSDLFHPKRTLMRRYFLVEKAKDANIVGILVGTLGVAGYLDMINQMKQLITKAGKKAYVFVMGRPNPAKLANFPECEVFIYVSCAQTTLLDSKEFLAPVITPFEATIAFGRGKQWTEEYTLHFRELIDAPLVEECCHSDEARYSFIQGGYVEDLDRKDDTEVNANVNLSLAVATEQALQLNSKALMRGSAKSGAEFLAARSYQGLEVFNDSPPAPFFIGRTGKASGYDDETQHT